MEKQERRNGLHINDLLRKSLNIPEGRAEQTRQLGNLNLA